MANRYGVQLQAHGGFKAGYDVRAGSARLAVQKVLSGGWREGAVEKLAKAHDVTISVRRVETNIPVGQHSVVCCGGSRQWQQMLANEYRAWNERHKRRTERLRGGSA